MLSDLHFDPLQDPDKVPLLAAAPVERWRAILDAPPSANQATRFAAVQSACSGKAAADTSYALLRSSLAAAQTQAASAAFVTVSGDLLVHDLDCRYRVAMALPPDTNDDQSVSASFAEKTTVFVMQQVNEAFSRKPVYLALGNNDSRCNHNRMDVADRYLAASRAAMLAGLRGVSAADKAVAARTYAQAGYYAVTMAAPMQRTRLIVIDNTYMMPTFAPCPAGGANAGTDRRGTDRRGEEEQMAWMQKELDGARRQHQRVWVLGHLPPVVASAGSHAADAPFCSGGNVARYQRTEQLMQTMEANAGLIHLGIFGHTHMDEFYLLPAQSVGAAGNNGGVPVKVVASITPASGSLPSFTIASVDPATAAVTDYALYRASNSSGAATVWTQEYTFSGTYHEPAFSSAALSDLMARFHADANGTGPESKAYREHFSKGGTGRKQIADWSGYACALDHPSADAYKACACAAR